jgi:hypothetical protein
MWITRKVTHLYSSFADTTFLWSPDVCRLFTEHVFSKSIKQNDDSNIEKFCWISSFLPPVTSGLDLPNVSTLFSSSIGCRLLESLLDFTRFICEYALKLLFLKLEKVQPHFACVDEGERRFFRYCSWDLRSSGIFCSLFLTDVSGQLMGHKTSVRNYYYTLSNIPEGRRFHIIRCGSLNSRLVNLYGETTLRHVQRFERLRMGAISYPETSLRSYHCTLHNIPEDHRPHQLRLKSNIG